MLRRTLLGADYFGADQHRDAAIVAHGGPNIPRKGFRKTLSRYTQLNKLGRLQRKANCVCSAQCTAMAERSCRGNSSKRRTVILDDAPRCLDDPSAYPRPRPRAWAVPIVAGLAARGLSPVCSSIGQGDRAIRLRNFAPRAAIQTTIGGPKLHLKHRVRPAVPRGTTALPMNDQRGCRAFFNRLDYALPSSPRAKT